MLSKILIKFEIILIFVEILEPPIIQVTGFVISEVIFFSAFISSINCKPAIRWNKFCNSLSIEE